MRIKIKNFGPIKAGYEEGDGFIDIPRVTLFCGPQGSGKSTASKFFSSMTWLEKWVYKNPGFALTEEFFRETLAWQGIDDYLSSDSEIIFQGDLYKISYENGHVSIVKIGCESSYKKPKVSYIPAERNFTSIIRNAMGLAHLPRPILDLVIKFEDAKERFKSGYKLPSNGYKFVYDSTSHESYILNGEDTSNDGRTKLEKASSGLQSIVPLLLVSDYVAQQIRPDYDVAKDGLSYKASTPEEKVTIETRIRDVLGSEMSNDEKRDNLVRYLAPGARFINIVEEPEQNLYPATQAKVVGHLLKLANMTDSNRLLISTHSPFVVNDLVSASLTKSLYEQATLKGDGDMMAEIARIRPEECSVAQRDMALYEFDEEGGIRLLSAEGGVFSDANVLNREMEKWNNTFGELLSIGQSHPGDNHV